MADNIIIVGNVSGVYGVKGWVKLYSWTQPKENIIEYSPLLLEQADKSWTAVTVLAAKPQGRTVIAQLEGVTDRDQAAALVGKNLAIDAVQLPALEEGWYWSELIGLTVMNAADEALGTVTGLQETGANDVLEVDSGVSVILIPFVLGPVVKAVDLQAGLIQVDWDPEYL